jgi:drug/metabolite transporter (DMT)-like permease
MTRRGLVLFGLMALIWGIPYLLIRVAVAEISPAVLVFGRTAIAACVLLPLALARTDIRAVLARWRWVAAFAIAEIMIPWVLLGSAEQHIASSLAGLIVAAVPLVATALAFVTRGRDRIGASGAVGMLVGLAGVAAIVGVEASSANAGAMLEMAIVVLGYAIGPAIMARRLDGLPPVGVMALATSLVAVVYAPVAFLQAPATVPSPSVLVAVVVLGLVCTATAFVVFAWLVAEVGPVRATLVTYLNPAVAALLGIAVLGESFTPLMAGGLALVVAGSALATRAQGTPPRAGESDVLDTEAEADARRGVGLDAGPAV